MVVLRRLVGLAVFAIVTVENVAQQVADDGEPALIRGRCVDAASGQPLARCRVQFLKGRARNNPPELTDTVLTNADGRFAARVIDGKAYELHLRISRAGYIPRTGAWLGLKPGSVEELGDIKMRRGIYATGEIFDQHGQPIIGAKVQFFGLSLELDAKAGSRRARHSMAKGDSWTRSGPGGVFKSRDALPAGKHGIRLLGAGIVSAVRTTISISEPVGAGPRFVVRTRPTMRGRVLDDLGRPVESVWLRVGVQGPKVFRTLGMVSTGEHGYFRMSFDKPPPRVWIEVEEGGRCERGAKIPDVAWDRDHVIRLQRRPCVELVVVEQGTGRPIDRFAVRSFNRKWAGSLRPALRLSGRHPGGQLRVEGISRGKAWIEVVPADTTLLPVVIEVEGSDRVKIYRVRIPRLVPMKIRIVDPNGKPVSGRAVQVVLLGPKAFHGGLRDPRASKGRAPSVSSGSSFDTLVFQAKTDVAGKCIVFGIARRKGLEIRVVGGSGTTSTVVTFGAERATRNIVLSR